MNLCLLGTQESSIIRATNQEQAIPVTMGHIQQLYEEKRMIFYMDITLISSHILDAKTCLHRETIPKECHAPVP